MLSACTVSLHCQPVLIAESLQSPLPPNLLMRYCHISQSIRIRCQPPAMGLCASSWLSTLAYLHTSLLLCSLFAELCLYSRRLFVQHQLLHA